jgi:peptidoglycan/LPS O-acetylase OafA/YrhL
VPILIATAWFMRGLAWYWTPVVAIPVALLVAALFAQFVEGPSHRLSQRVGRAVERRLGADSEHG